MNKTVNYFNSTWLTYFLTHLYHEPVNSSTNDADEN